MNREEKTEQIIQILEEYGIISPKDRQDIPLTCQQVSQTDRQADH
jgi:hypothetical protein